MLWIQGRLHSSSSAVGMDGDISGVSSTEEEKGGVKKEEGLRRLATGLLLLTGSGVS